MLHIPRRLHQPALEIVETGGRDPRVVSGKRLDTLMMDLRREQLSERGRHRLDPRLRATEGDVRFADQPDRRQHVPLVFHFLPGNAEIDPQLNPELDAAGTRLGAVVIDDPPDPLAAHVGVGAIGEDRGILARHDALVRQAIGGPSLKLPPTEPALVHELVKGMLHVVRAVERPECRFQLRGAERTIEPRKRRRGRRGQLRGNEGRGHDRPRG